MAQFNENITLAAPNPLDKRYLSNRTSGGAQLPYSGTSEVYANIPLTVRYIGLTVLINGSETAYQNTEYWFENGTGNSDLVQKIYDSVLPLGDYVTGATNIGYFSGFTGVQHLCLTPNSPLSSDYSGWYDSLYNNYFRGCDQVIRIGAGSDNIPKRGYLKSSAIPAQVKSWIWDDNYSGWSLIDGNISLQLGTVQPTVSYNTPIYTATTWTSSCSNGSKININAVTGSLTTGSTLSIGGPVFGCMAHNNLHFRTMYTCTPNTLSVCYNEAFIYLSGKTAIVDGTNIGVGANILKTPYTGTTLEFRRLRGSGATTITQVGDSIIISSTSGSGGTTGGTGTITGATNGLYVTGAKLGLSGNLCQNTNINGVAAYDFNIINIDDFQVNTAGGVGNQVILGLSPTAGVYMEHCGTSVSLESNRGLEYAADYSANFSNCSLITKEYADNLFASGSTYNLASPSVIPLGGICSGTVLTGKTAFQLFEELLVPELCGTITPPGTTIGLSASGLYEIGCTISQTVNGTFSRGLISPQYCSVSGFRSGCANAYCFTGTGMPSGLQACVLTPGTAINPSYIVVIGTQSWGVCTRYDAGSPALGSKGTQYSAALPSGCTSAASGSIVGVYPLFATTSSITTLTAQALQNMSTANNIQINLVSESSPDKQKFEIPCAWLGAPTSRPLVGVCQWNTVSSQWEYPGGSAGTSLAIWTCSSASETVQGNSIGYCRYTYNSTDRSAVCIRLVF